MLSEHYDTHKDSQRTRSIVHMPALLGCCLLLPPVRFLLLLVILLPSFADILHLHEDPGSETQSGAGCKLASRNNGT